MVVSHDVHISHLNGKTLEKRKKELSSSGLSVFEAIISRWPTNPLGVAEELGVKGNIKSLSSRYLYHFKKLKKLGLIDMKKLGNTYVAWPVEVDKIRFLHDFLRDGD